MIEELAALIPKHLLAMSGSVFYSGRNAFRSSSPLYVLGVNPGGSPETQANETIDWHTNKVLAMEPDDWSAYRDESWRSAIPGTSGMQPRVLHMMNHLGLSPGDVPASNVAFVRSRREATQDFEFESLADICWDFHRSALAQLKPRVVLCFGKTAGEYVRKKLQATEQVGEFIERNNRRWRTCAFRNDEGTAVVIATHPSIADWTAPATDPSLLIAEMLAK